MLRQDNGKNLNTKEIIVVSQDYPKPLRSSMTCGNQKAKQTLTVR